MFRKTAKIVDLPAAIVGDLNTMKSDAKEKKRDQAKADVEKNMGLMRDALYGLSDATAEATDVAQELYSLHFISIVLAHIQDLSFDTRKHFKDIFSFFIHSKPEAGLLVEHLKSNPEIMRTLICGISKADNQTALVYCDMLKAAFKHAALCSMVLRDVEISGVLYDSVYNEEYAVASAAFQTLRQLLTEHPEVYLSVISSSAERENIFFGRFHKLLQSGNVVHKRKMLQLLEQLLDTPKAADLRARYVAKLENLKIIVGLFDAHVELVQRAAGVLLMFVEGRNEAVLSTLATLKVPLLQALDAPKPDTKAGDTPKAEAKGTDAVGLLKSKLAEL